jgi:hypothetical protein
MNASDFAALPDRGQSSSEGHPEFEGRSYTGSAQDERRAEFHTVLEEIDTILRLLRVQIDEARAAPESAVRETPAASAPASESLGAETIVAQDETIWGARSPFLDDRLATAREVAAGISTEFDTIQRQTLDLGTAVATLRSELDRASEELAFLRTNEAAPRTVAPSPKLAERRVPRPTPPDPTPSRRARPAPDGFDAFTVARYNETVRDLQGRRHRLRATTIVLAVAISAALLVLAYLTHEPTPPWWLAGLPIIWMIPVPFFLSSFVGTHRILADQPLDLPEAR